MKKINFLAVLVILTMTIGTAHAQSGEKTQEGKWDRSYGGTDKSYDTTLLRMRAEIAPLFQKMTFQDEETGGTMEYNLYIPKNYDPSKKYPLVLFMADASTVGKGVMAPLMQGYGGIIWATEESQAKNPCFIMVPSFVGPGWVVNDTWDTSPEVDRALRLLQSVVKQYSVDSNRIYTTGQSMGGMISFYFNSTNPDLFAASLFVGSQWDVNVLEPLTNDAFFYIVSAGDERASGGMKSLGEMFNKKGVTYGDLEFSARLPHSEQEEAIQELLKGHHKINFVRFTKGTVTPEGATGGGAEHMYSFDYAYQLATVRDWLFEQTREKSGSNKGGRRNDPTRELVEQGINYLNGTGGMERDYAQAKELFEQAWQAGGHMKAPRYLGIMYEEGLGVRIDYTRARAYYQEASDAGDITAAARIGALYEKGLGVKRNNEEALKWYLKAAPSPEEAAKNIHPRIFALMRLGYFCEKGLGGITRDQDKAIAWYQVAAQSPLAEDQKSVEEANAAIKRLSK